MKFKKLLYSAVFVTTALFTNNALAGSIKIEVEASDALVEGTPDGDLKYENDGTTLGYIDEGDYITYNKLDLTNVTSFSANAGSKKGAGFIITMHLDANGVPGQEIASITFDNTGGWQTYVTTAEGALNVSLTGEHKIHFVLSGGFNLDSFLLNGDDIVDDTPATVGDVFTEGDYDFIVTNLDPLEAEVTGSTLSTLSIPATATDAVKSTEYAVTAVGGAAFKDNTTITSVVLPASVILIKGDAFSGCVNLETINLEHVLVTNSFNTFYNCPKLTTANLAAITNIGNFMFYGLGDSSLSSISIPNAVIIGKSAFNTTKISSIDIPATVTSIEDKVFMDCTSLTEVQVRWTTADALPTIVPVGVSDEDGLDLGTFLNLTPANIKLIVPEGTADIYAAAEVWQDFNIQEEVLSTDAIARELGFNVASNVVDNVVSVQNSELKKATITIFSVNGSTVLTTNANNLENSIDVSGLSTGVYLMRISTEEYTFVERIIKK